MVSNIWVVRTSSAYHLCSYTGGAPPLVGVKEGFAIWDRDNHILLKSRIVANTLFFSVFCVWVWGYVRREYQWLYAKLRDRDRKRLGISGSQQRTSFLYIFIFVRLLPCRWMLVVVVIDGLSNVSSSNISIVGIFNFNLVNHASFLIQ